MKTRLFQSISSIFHLLSVIFDHIILCGILAWRLFTILIHGTSFWVFMLMRLLLFTTLLGPGWFDMLKFWLFDPRVIKNIEYTSEGAMNRHLLDIYLPKHFYSPTRSIKDLFSSPSKSKKTSKKEVGAPVLIFVSGGAWMIGYKLWVALAARVFSNFGILVVVPDYRNFPQGDIEDMMTDVSLAVAWTKENAHKFGGDPSLVSLAGQSAGAHICLCLYTEGLAWALNQSSPSSPLPLPPPRSDLSTLSCVLGISGPCHLSQLASHLHQRGLDRSLMQSICRGDLTQYCPTIRLHSILEREKLRGNRRERRKEEVEVDINHSNPIPPPSVPIPSSSLSLLSSLPPLVLVHGDEDSTVPAPLCLPFLSLLREIESLMREREEREQREESGERKGEGREAYNDYSYSSSTPSPTTPTPSTTPSHILGSPPSSPPPLPSLLPPPLPPPSFSLSHLWVYEGCSHTDPILEGPLGGREGVLGDVSSLLIALARRNRDRRGERDEGDGGEEEKSTQNNPSSHPPLSLLLSPQSLFPSDNCPSSPSSPSPTSPSPSYRYIPLPLPLPPSPSSSRISSLLSFLPSLSHSSPSLKPPFPLPPPPPPSPPPPSAQRSVPDSLLSMARYCNPF